MKCSFDFHFSNFPPFFFLFIKLLDVIKFSITPVPEAATYNIKIKIMKIEKKESLPVTMILLLRVAAFSDSLGDIRAPAMVQLFSPSTSNSVLSRY